MMLKSKRNGFRRERQCPSVDEERLSQFLSWSGYSRFICTAAPNKNARISKPQTHARADRGTPGEYTHQKLTKGCWTLRPVAARARLGRRRSSKRPVALSLRVASRPSNASSSASLASRASRRLPRNVPPTQHLCGSNFGRGGSRRSPHNLTHWLISTQHITRVKPAARRARTPPAGSPALRSDLPRKNRSTSGCSTPSSSTAARRLALRTRTMSPSRMP